jgi:hypothetical protein
VAQGALSVHAAFLSIGLSLSASAPHYGPSIWESASPAASLTLDLLAASEGKPLASPGEILTATFSSMESAISAARRLQWAFQGFSEEGELQGSTVAVLIHSPDDPSPAEADGHSRNPMDRIAPGGIALTEKASAAFHDLPGFLLEPAGDAGLRELRWLDPEDRADRASDEAFVADLMERRGFKEPAVEAPKGPGAVPLAAAAAANGAAKSDLGPIVLERIEAGVGFLRANRRWAIGAGCAAALLLAAVAILNRPHAKAPAVPPAPAQLSGTAATGGQSAPAANRETHTPSGGQSPKQAAPPPPKPTSKPAEATAPRNAQANAPAPVQQPAPRAPEPAPAQRGRCDLDPSQIPGAIEQAEKSLARGRYGDAQRQFGSVLACEPGNGRARDGMERTRRAREAEGDSSE